MKYHIVIADEVKAHRAHKESYKLHPHIRVTLQSRPIGTIHGEADTDCPKCTCGHEGELHGNEGCEQCDCIEFKRRINCRNCGDPDYYESCQAAGHCPECGTIHGIAPDSVIKKNGYMLVKA